MLIKINGQPAAVADGLSLQTLISTRGLGDKAVIVELNGTLVPRGSWDSIQLKPDDCLEIIRLIGGG